MALNDEELRVALRALDMLDLKGWPAAKLQVLNECLLADGEEVTSRKIAHRTGISIGVAQRYLDQLTDDKLLERIEGAGRRGTIRSLADPDVWRVRPRSKLGRELWLRRIADPLDRDDLLPSNARNRAPLRAHPWGRAQRESSARTRIGARYEPNSETCARTQDARASDEFARAPMGARATENFEDRCARPSAARATSDENEGHSFSLELLTTSRTDGLRDHLRRALLERGQRVEGKLLNDAVEAVGELDVDQVLDELRRQPLAEPGAGYQELAYLRHAAARVRHHQTDLPPGSEPQERLFFMPGAGWISRDGVTPSWKTDPADDVDEVGGW